MKSLPPITLNMERIVRSLGWLMLVAVILVFVWRGAGWVWYFAAPRPNPLVPDLRSVVNVGNVARLPWFGVFVQTPTAAPVSDIKIMGLFAGGARPTALLVIGSQNPIAVTVGESPLPGLQLISVAADHVVVQRNGINEKIMLTGSTAAIQRNTKGKKDSPDEIRTRDE